MTAARRGHRAGARAIPRRPAAGSRRWLGIVVAGWLLAACTHLAPLPTVAGDSVSGRLAVRVDALGNEPARSLSAAFDLRGSAGSGVLGLATPLGTLLAQARWAPGEVTLATPNETRRYASLGELTADVLGESIPVEAWFDWLRGRPWPGATSDAQIQPPAAAAPSSSSASASAAPGARFEQLGWDVDARSLAEGLVVATRHTPLPLVVVRVKLDPPS